MCGLAAESSNSIEMGVEVEKSHTLCALPILIIHAHSSCNCRCIMCDIWKTREARTFGLRELDSQLDSIRRLGVQWIVFSGGEPLMNAELPQLCSVLRKEGIRLTLLSTGLLLKKYAEEVAENFDEVIVSLDGPPKVHDLVRRVHGAFELLKDGVHVLRKVRQNMRITARSTVQKANYHCLLETARTAREIELDQISYLAADLTSTAFNRPLTWPESRQAEISLTHAELSLLEDSMEMLIRESKEKFGREFIAESPEKLRRIVRYFRAQLGLEEPEAPVCNAPWKSAVIEADGNVRPCFFHPIIGNLNGRRLEEVINGEKGRTFRTGLDIANNATCKKCVCSLNYRP